MTEPTPILPADLLRWEYHSDPNCMTLLVHLLLLASPTPIRIDGVTYPAGTVRASRADMAKKTGLTIKQYRIALEKLIKSNRAKIGAKITAKTKNAIIICNYESYGLQSLSDRPRIGPIIGHTSEKETKQEKENFPPHPLYKEKEINKEKDSLSPLPPRERGDFLKIFFSEENYAMLQNFARSLQGCRDHPPFPYLRELAAEVINDKKLQGTWPEDYPAQARDVMNLARAKHLSRMRTGTANLPPRPRPSPKTPAPPESPANQGKAPALHGKKLAALLASRGYLSGGSPQEARKLPDNGRKSAG